MCGSVSTTNQSVENDFIWSEGAAVTYTNWDEDSGEPNNSGTDGQDCTSIKIVSEFAKWGDETCTLRRNFLCSGPMVSSTIPEPTTSSSTSTVAPTTSPTTTPQPTTSPSITTETPSTTSTTTPEPTTQTLSVSESCDGEKLDATCFKLFTALIAWDYARRDCLEWGGDLATIKSEEENIFARELMTEASLTGNLWIGFNDQAVEGTFEWSDGSEVVYTNWQTGQPNNAFAGTDGLGQDCTAMQLSSAVGEWGDGKCWGLKSYLCSHIWCDGSLYDGTCFQYVDAEVTRADAQTACEAWGGNLATIKSEEENIFLSELVAVNSSKPWIGLNAIENEFEFVWEDGSSSTYTNWATDIGKVEGSEGDDGDCVRITSLETGQWEKMDCIESMTYICSKT